jgi:hypothetical protein
LGDTINDEMNGACADMGKLKCVKLLVRKYEGKSYLEVSCRYYN